MNVTLDMNQLIALENNYSHAADIRELKAMNDRQEITLQVCAMSASERQRNGMFLKTFADFKAWIGTLGLDRCRLIMPLAYFDISYLDYCMLGGFGTKVLEAEIHKILFGNTDIAFQYEAHKGRYLRESEAVQKDEYNRWRNAKCDVQSFWSHVIAGGGIFVTDDGNFHKATKKPDLLVLSGGEILRPGDAVSFIKSGQGIQRPLFDVQTFARTPDLPGKEDAVPKELKHYWTWRNGYLAAVAAKAARKSANDGIVNN